MEEIYDPIVQMCMSNKLSENKLVNQRVFKRALAYTLLEVASFGGQYPEPFIDRFMKKYKDVDHIMYLAKFSLDEVLGLVQKVLVER